MASSCTNGIIKIWKIGFNPGNHLELLMSLEFKPYVSYEMTENIEELLLSDRNSKDPHESYLAISRQD